MKQTKSKSTVFKSTIDIYGYLVPRSSVHRLLAVTNVMTVCPLEINNMHWPRIL